MKPTKPQIIYISGYGRSGSTLLSLLLNTLPNTVNIGEADYLFRTDDSQFPEFWKQTKNKALQVSELPNAAVLSKQKIASVLWYYRKRKKGAKIFKDLWTPVISEVCNYYNAHTLVDASKSTFGSFARPIYYKKAGYSVKVIHLVRNPHGVMASYKKGRNTSNSEELAPAKKGGALRGLLSWFFTNVMTRFAYKSEFNKNELFVLTYDRLMSDFKGQTKELFQFLEQEAPENLLASEIKLQEDISFSGNRLRLKKTIKIAPYSLNKGKGLVSLLARMLNRMYKLIEPNYVTKNP